ncbi:MAG TPA: hypothetical protein VJT31_26290 [Rugosimonospora sp.]|nr:hypothetical protein [Rugosimonospora sp.]
MPIKEPFPLHLQVHETGGNNVLALGPRYREPMRGDDTVVIAVSHRGGYSQRSVLVSRAQMRELADWCNRWLDEGWPGVTPQEGPTTSDVIEHYRDIAVRYRIEADHTRIDADRRVDAALALIPPDRRGEDLRAIAQEQAEHWQRLQTERDELEKLRRVWVQGMIDIVQSTTPSASAIRTAIGKLIEAQHRIVSGFSAKPKDPGPTPESPLYQVRTNASGDAAVGRAR